MEEGFGVVDFCRDVDRGVVMVDGVTERERARFEVVDESRGLFVVG